MKKTSPWMTPFGIATALAAIAFLGWRWQKTSSLA
jgi:hypothetical protein